MKKIKLLLKSSLAAIALLAMTSCEEDLLIYTGDGDATAFSFARTSETVPFCTPTATITVEATKASSQARTVNFSVNAGSTADPSEYNLPAMSVTIPAGEYTGSVEMSVNFGAIPDGQTSQLILDLTVPADGTLNTRGTTTLSFASACVLNEVNLDLAFDSYPGETAWQIYTAAGAFVTGDTAFGNYAGQSSFSTTLCLESGDYLLRLLDSFGDGFCCAYGNGSADLTNVACDGNSPVIPTISSEFTGGELIVPFTLGN